MKDDAVTALRERGIQPSAQRVAVAEYVLETDEHPSADEVWSRVQRNFPMISRATVYNTLNLFVEKGLLQEHVLAEGRLVYDPNTTRHHHFIDEASGRIHDIPWEAVRVDGVESLPGGFSVRSYQVVMRGRKKRG
ncbi:MAG: Fur family transcriptional regulator [Minicystis sp.]